MPPVIEPRFARVAAAIGDASRASILARLLDGRAYTATELAVHAGITPPTASQHLRLLLDESLVRVRAQGRHRYFTLADANVGHLLESLMHFADGVLPETMRWQKQEMRALRGARTCYGHLAGELGVSLCRGLIARAWVRASDHDALEYSLSEAGIAQLENLGVGADLLSSKRKRLLYACLDWSERRDHFAGAIAVAMLEQFIARKWLKRESDSRVLALTASGAVQLQRQFLE
jgi:DNA-binding transcriptional ArsR family regulator